MHVIPKLLFNQGDVESVEKRIILLPWLQTYIKVVTFLKHKITKKKKKEKKKFSL
jgi:hypothetical protein